MSMLQKEDLVATSLSDFINVVRRDLGGRRGLILLAALGLVAGAYLNWGWLVAVGIAPLLLTALPCAAMCALGLCMNNMANRVPSAMSQPQDGSTGGEPAKISPLRLIESQDQTSVQYAVDDEQNANKPKGCCQAKIER